MRNIHYASTYIAGIMGQLFVLLGEIRHSTMFLANNRHPHLHYRAFEGNVKLDRNIQGDMVEEMQHRDTSIHDPHRLMQARLDVPFGMKPGRGLLTCRL